MPFPSRRVLMAAVPALAMSSCMFFSPGRSAAAYHLTVEERGEQVFRTYQIPADHAYGDHRVTSGPFVVDGTWGVVPVESRVYCGHDEDGLPRARDARVELVVTLLLSERYDGTFVTLESYGETLPQPGRQEGVPCRLSRRFEQELLTAVAGRPGERLRLPGMARPGVVQPPGLPASGPTVRIPR